jgi:hypothetical protein
METALTPYSGLGFGQLQRRRLFPRFTSLAIGAPTTASAVVEDQPE